MKCDECGTIVTEDDLFCGECGAVLPMSVPDEIGAVPEAVAPPQPDTSSAPAHQDTRANVAFISGIVSIAMAAIACVPIPFVFSCLGPIVGITAIVLGALGLYASTMNADYIARTDPRTRGAIGGGGGGPFVG